MKTKLYEMLSKKFSVVGLKWFNALTEGPSFWIEVSIQQPYSEKLIEFDIGEVNSINSGEFFEKHFLEKEGGEQYFLFDGTATILNKKSFLQLTAFKKLISEI